MSISSITKQPGRCGGDACIRDTRIPVWSLVEAGWLGSSAADLLESFPSLTPADLQAAQHYYQQSLLEIERNIWENQAVMEESDGDRRLALIVRGWNLGLTDEEVGATFEPAVSTAAMQEMRRDYSARKEAFDALLDRISELQPRVPVPWPAKFTSFDAALFELLPSELREGMDVNGTAVR
jgi:uncharacterized protein (DUF433 family)